MFREKLLMSIYNLKKITLIVSLFLFSFVSIAQSAEIYVASWGSDQGDGSFNSPFASIERARQEILNIKQQNAFQDFTVYLRGGTYKLADTLVLGPEDSPEPGYKIIYKAYQGETPVITSDVSVTGWSSVNVADEPYGLASEASGNLWSANIPAGIDLPKMMYDGNDILPRAIGEGFKPTNPPEDPDQDQWMLPFPDGALRDYNNMEDVEIKIIPIWFSMNILPLDYVLEGRNIAKVKVYSSYDISQDPVYDGNTVWVENVPDALDEPSEWIVNTQEGKIYYWPEEGQPSDEIVVPSLQEYIRVEGDEGLDRPVHGLIFEGITFKRGERITWNDNTICLKHDYELYDANNAMLRFRTTEDCTVKDCTFATSGGVGVRFDLRSIGNEIVNNTFYDLGGSAIVLCGYGPGVVDLNHHNKIINNYIHHIGQQYWTGMGVFVYQSGYNVISHNYLHDLPRGGMEVSTHRSPYFNPNRQSREVGAIRFDELGGINDWPEIVPFFHNNYNLIQYNEITKMLQKLEDGSGVEVTSAGEGNVVKRNYIHHSYDAQVSGLRTDNQQNDTYFKENIIYKVFGRGITLKYRNTAVNNFIVDILQPPEGRTQGYMALKDGPNSGTSIKRNIYYHSQSMDNFENFYKELPDFVPWADHDDISDKNIFYSRQDPCVAENYLAYLQGEGSDINSIAVDPNFVNIITGDLKLQADSPALSQLGIEPLDHVLDCAGLGRPEDISCNGQVDLMDISLFAGQWGINNLYRPELPGELVAWWKFDERGGGIAYDSSGNGYDAAVTGAAAASGIIGPSLEFEGQDYVDVPSEVFTNISDQITITFWQYGDTAIQPQDDYIVKAFNEKGKALAILLPWGTEEIIWDAGIDANSNYDRLGQLAFPEEYEGQWNHWAFTKDTQGHMRIYLNGAVWASKEGTTKTFEGINTCQIGASGSGSNNYDGRIDDFRIYNYALDWRDIQALFNGSVHIPNPERCSNYVRSDLDYDCRVDFNDLEILVEKWLDEQQLNVEPAGNLLGHWKFDQSQGTNVPDSSGNGYDGSASAIEWVSGVDGNAVKFNSENSYIAIPEEIFSSLDEEITVMFWQYGDTDVQPNADSIIQAHASGGRVLGIHLPWSSENVIWDAGSDPNGGNYDRLEKFAIPSEYEGQWNHWVFTKSARTREMKIYLNGQLWAIGYNNSQKFYPVDIIKIGSDASGTNSYLNGLLDDFRIYDYELSAEEIRSIFENQIGI